MFWRILFIFFLFASPLLGADACKIVAVRPFSEHSFTVNLEASVKQGKYSFYGIYIFDLKNGGYHIVKLFDFETNDDLAKMFAIRQPQYSDKPMAIWFYFLYRWPEKIIAKK